ncbi:MAG TPA: hypothetical protein VKU36_04245, partial [Candidatus Babeliales bacterium]|nr:hypothetical protein [Candidatus Babeliales bacterium]
MKKKISHIHALLLLPLATASPLLCMEKELANSHEKHPLEESMIITEETTGGLGFFRTPSDIIFGVGPNICSDLQNRKYQANHTGYQRKLDAGIDYFLDKKDEAGI